MDIVTEKKCAKCGRIKKADLFYENKRMKTGLGSWCISCIRNFNIEWNKKNKEKRKQYDKLYKERNRKKLANMQKEYRLSNLDKCRLSVSKSMKIKKNKYRKYTSEWGIKNRDKRNATDEKRRARKAGNGGCYTAQEWRDLCDRYGNKCLACGAAGVKLSVDHVIPISKGGSNSNDNLQPLCISCNSSKGTKTIDYR